MTLPPPRPSGRRQRTAADLRTLGIAAAVLAVAGAVWVWMARSAAERRASVLASVPAFPAPGQEPRARVSSPADPVRPVPPKGSQPPAAIQAAPPARADPMTSFVLHPSHDVALVHVNALLNTPLFERIRECLPLQWKDFTAEAAELGIDLERDVDRLAVTADGMAISGFFAGKPIARNIARGQLEEREYRGHPVWLSPDTDLGGMGIAQVGNLLLAGPSGSMDSLIDRALDPPPPGTDPQDVYGDLFIRSDLSRLSGENRAGQPEAIRAILDGLSGVTVRANVWDTVALSIEGTPQTGRSVADLAAMVRAALLLARQQLDPDEVELATLAELAKVGSSTDSLNIDLVLPMKDLLNELHFPCFGGEPADRHPDEVGSASP